MTENLKTQQELLTDFADNDTQDITPEMYRNFVVSVLSVGTGEANTGVDPQANGSARDVEVGKGLTRLGNRRFQVDPSGDGLYRFEAEGQCDIDIEANVRVAIVKNDIAPPDEGAPDYILTRRMYPGGKNEATNYVHFFEYHNVVEGDIIELQFDETGGANVSNVDYVFIGHRIG